MVNKSSLFNGSEKIINEKQFRVCVVCPVYHPGLGGIGRQAVSLTTELHKRGLNIFVITRKLKNVPSFSSEVKSIRLWAARPSVYRIEAKTFLNILTSATFSVNLLYTLIKKKKDYDIVHFHGASIPLITTLPFLKILKKKVIAKVSSAKLGIEAGSFYGRYGFLGKFFISLLKNVNVFVAISNEIEEGLICEGYDKNRIHRIPNFVDLTLFHPGYERSGLNKTIVFSGALERRKGVHILLEAWKTIHKEFPDVHLIILGDGPEKAYLHAMAKDLNISDSITFKGQVNNVTDYLHNAYIFVLPSLQEGLPNSLLEAMACGLPVIASKIGGVIDIVENGRSGILFEPGNISDLTYAIRTLLENDEVRNKLRTEAVKRIAEKFSIDRIAEEYIILYRKL
jgi:glycosyltransferase involved in cell wall biosynthesis